MASRYKVAVSNELIDGQLDMAAAYEEKGTTAVPGMTYEQGVIAGIRWVLGDVAEAPIEEALEEEGEEEEE